MAAAARKRAFVLLLVAALALWIALDLYLPLHHDLRRFAPVQVAALETAMWRSYYDHRPIALFRELTTLLRQEYGMPLWRSGVAAYRAAHAARVFQRGRSRGDYELALPDLVSYYGLIRRSSSTPFDVGEAARLELEWWIVHRERASHASGDLDTALARLQAAIYSLPAARFAMHARYRSEAMRIRDAQAGQGLTAVDWRRIEQLLRLSWGSLHSAVAEKL
ncbi:MAG: hypothetical protein LAP87_25295 [Acidobacteriia bacterium]|nr:hypothetical protein [Terriglobia bacterium]